MILKVTAVLFVLSAAGGYMWWVAFRTLRRREVITKIGANLLRPNEVFSLYRHDVQVTRMLERLVQQDRTIPFLEPEDRAQAERLISQFYDERG